MKTEKDVIPKAVGFHSCKLMCDKIKSEATHLVLFVLLLNIFTGCSPKLYVYKSSWQNTPITVDGKSTDWKLPLMYNDPDTKLNYSITNDSTNLYLFIETNEDATVSGITKNGFQIWIDTTGKKNHQVGILYPIPQRLDNSSGNGNRQRRNQNTQNSGQPQYSPNGEKKDTTKQAAMHRSFKERTRQMHVSGFKTILNGLVELPDTVGINLGISWSNTNYLVYEAVISLKSFFKYPLAPSDSSKVIGISFNYNSIPKAGNNGNGGPRMHPNFGFGVGMMGVMMNSGGGYGGGGTPDPVAVSVWKPIHLSTLPTK